MTVIFIVLASMFTMGFFQDSNVTQITTIPMNTSSNNVTTSNVSSTAESLDFNVTSSPNDTISTTSKVVNNGNTVNNILCTLATLFGTTSSSCNPSNNVDCIRPPLMTIVCFILVTTIQT
jgi:hypothetical protein